MIILGLAELFETMDRPDSARPDRRSHSLISYFSESIEDKELKFLHNFDFRHQIDLSKFGMDIFESLEIMRFSALSQFQQFSATFLS